MKLLETCFMMILVIPQVVLGEGHGATADASREFEENGGNEESLAQELEKRARMRPQFVGKRNIFIPEDTLFNGDAAISPDWSSNLDAILRNLPTDTSDPSSQQSELFNRQARYTPRFVGRRSMLTFDRESRWTPKFVGKRRSPLFIGRRRSPYFVGKRADEELLEDKRARPLFIGKRSNPMLVARGFIKPKFVGRRSSGPILLGRREPSSDLDSAIFLGKRSVKTNYNRHIPEQIKLIGNTRQIRSVEKIRHYKRAWETFQPRVDLHIGTEDQLRLEKKFNSPDFIGKRGTGKLFSNDPSPSFEDLMNTFLIGIKPVPPYSNLALKQRSWFNIPNFAMSTPERKRQYVTEGMNTNNYTKRWGASDFIGKRGFNSRIVDRHKQIKRFASEDKNTLKIFDNLLHNLEHIDSGLRDNPYSNRILKPFALFQKRQFGSNVPDFIGKRFSADFVGKRNALQKESLVVVDKPEIDWDSYKLAPYHVDKRFSADFIGKREQTPAKFLPSPYNGVPAYLIDTLLQYIDVYEQGKSSLSDHTQRRHKRADHSLKSKRFSADFIGKRDQFQSSVPSLVDGFVQDFKNKNRLEDDYYDLNKLFAADDISKHSQTGTSSLNNKRFSADFVGKRNKINDPLLIDKRFSADFVGKRNEFVDPLVDDKRFSADFVGKRNEIVGPLVVDKRFSADFVGKRNEFIAPPVLHKTFSADFIGKRNEFVVPPAVDKRFSADFVGKRNEVIDLPVINKRFSADFVGKRNEFADTPVIDKGINSMTESSNLNSIIHLLSTEKLRYHSLGVSRAAIPESVGKRYSRSVPQNQKQNGTNLSINVNSENSNKTVNGKIKSSVQKIGSTGKHHFDAPDFVGKRSVKGFDLQDPIHSAVFDETATRETASNNWLVNKHVLPTMHQRDVVAKPSIDSSYSVTHNPKNGFRTKHLPAEELQQRQIMGSEFSTGSGLSSNKLKLVDKGGISRDHASMQKYELFKSGALTEPSKEANQFIDNDASRFSNFPHGHKDHDLYANALSNVDLSGLSNNVFAGARARAQAQEFDNA